MAGWIVRRLSDYDILSTGIFVTEILRTERTGLLSVKKKQAEPFLPPFRKPQTGIVHGEQLTLGIAGASPPYHGLPIIPLLHDRRYVRRDSIVMGTEHDPRLSPRKEDVGWRRTGPVTLLRNGIRHVDIDLATRHRKPPDQEFG